jgi:hypothetical protein
MRRDDDDDDDDDDEDDDDDVDDESFDEFESGEVGTQAMVVFMATPCAFAMESFLPSLVSASGD